MKKAKSAHQYRSNRLGSSIMNDSTAIQMQQEGKVYRQSMIRYEEEKLSNFLVKEGDTDENSEL
ncbi:MAG: hypothetical protein H6581_18985 [Bacteroidia bacterium]|nr:hypothetical protein [Bacteroidia bacterium]